MTHYYAISEKCSAYFTRKSGITINEILMYTYTLTWDHKRKLHHFNSLYHIDRDYNVIGEPVAFESLEHEREFLDNHPDAFNVRQFRWSGYHVSSTGTLQVFTEETLPIFKKGKRWFWKR